MRMDNRRLHQCHLMVVVRLLCCLVESYSFWAVTSRTMHVVDAYVVGWLSCYSHSIFQCCACNWMQEVVA